MVNKLTIAETPEIITQKEIYYNKDNAMDSRKNLLLWKSDKKSID